MNTDIDRLLRYMYGELEDEADFERALADCPDLFDTWFELHEVKQKLDAQPPPQPSASVVDRIVDQAAEAHKASPQPDRPAPISSSPRYEGDTVPCAPSGSWVAVSSPAYHEQRSTDPSASDRAPRASSRNQGAPTEHSHAVAWGIACMLALVMAVSSLPSSSPSPEPLPALSSTSSTTTLPDWDAPERRATLHRQAAALSERVGTRSASLAGPRSFSQ